MITVFVEGKTVFNAVSRTRLARKIENFTGLNPGPVRCCRVYRFPGGLAYEKVVLIASRLLSDPVTESFRFNRGLDQGESAVEIRLLEGESDISGQAVSSAAMDLGVHIHGAVRTGKLYLFMRKIRRTHLSRIAENILCNTVIERYSIIGGLRG